MRLAVLTHNFYLHLNLSLTTNYNLCKDRLFAGLSLPSNLLACCSFSYEKFRLKLQITWLFSLIYIYQFYFKKRIKGTTWRLPTSNFCVSSIFLKTSSHFSLSIFGFFSAAAHTLPPQNFKKKMKALESASISPGSRICPAAHRRD